MASTRERNSGVRSRASELRDEPGMPLFFDNYAACPICTIASNPRPCSERDDSVRRVEYDLSYICLVGHKFSEDTALWDVVPRG